MNSQQTIDEKNLVAKLMSGRTGRMKSYVAILLVSIGKENFEDEKLKAAVKMINQEFKSCCVVIADTLQRHNVATEKKESDQLAYEESLVKGDKWLVNYESYFAQTFKIPYEILRWDSLISSPGFVHKKQIFSSLLESNTVLQKAMEQSIDEYGQRLEKRMGKEAFNQILLQHKKNCFSYLQEECIAISLLPQGINLAEEGAPLTIIYPGKSTAILTANRDIFINSQFDKQMKAHEDYLNWLPYRFNRVNNPNGAEIESTKNSDKKINKLSIAKEVDYVNNLSEALLYAMHNLLDGVSLYEFNACVLDCLLEKNYSYCDPVTDMLNNNSTLSGRSLAYIFHSQMRTLFNTLDKKIANQCRANLVRILKRTNLHLSLKGNDNFLVL